MFNLKTAVVETVSTYFSENIKNVHMNVNKNEKEDCP